MFRSFLLRFLLLLLAAGMITIPDAGHAQAVLPRSGQSFTFGIIEGPYSFFDSASALQSTNLILTVVSAYSGCGIITSPSGYSQDFSFAPGAPTIINLPLNLIHLNDLGKTEKGLLVHTTEPVNLVLHDYIPYGGDASQILPDGALDTSYVACGWGIWDDVGEDDANEFIVTAVSDSTFVTITPSVRTTAGQADSVPFTVMLNRGECYIVKADTSDHPADPSLSGSTIHSSKPVSVISGLTCAYVPVAVEACNELMDELIGKKWWGSHFFIQPLDKNDPGGQFVLTNSNDFIAKINGGSVNSSHGRISMQFTGNVEIHTVDLSGNPFPVEAHQLTRSYSDCDSMSGDPSLVSVLDTSNYSDTVLWNTPSFLFIHSVANICRTADLGTATLDGTPLNLLGAPSAVINGSSYSAINPPVKAGLHKIISPDPVFAISAGFYIADAYSFIAGTAGSQQPEDSTGHVVVLQADSATACSEFDVTGSLGTPIQSAEGVITFTISVSYDPSILHLLQIIPLATLSNATFTVDTTTPGIIKISVLGTPLITGDSLFRFVFEAWKSTASTTVGLIGGATTICADDSEIITGLPAIFAVAPSNDTFPGTFLLANTNAALCQPLTITLSTDTIVTPADELVLSKIVIQYNVLTEQFVSVSPGNLIANKTFTQTDQPLGNIQLLFTPPASVSGGSAVLQIHFNPEMISPSDTIRVKIYYLHCGDTLTRTLAIAFPIVNSGAFAAPLTLAFDSTVLCIPDTAGILILDTSCETLTLQTVTVSGTDWTLLTGNGQPLKLPSIIESHSFYAIVVKFHPQAIGGEQDSITLTYIFNDSTFTRTIALSGIGKASGTLEVPTSKDFGIASLCTPVDSLLLFNNQSCGVATIDSIRMTQPFSLVTKLPLNINSGKLGSLKVQYAPNTITNDTGQAIVTYTVNDTVHTDTLAFTGIGKASGTVSKPTSPLVFNNATPCTPDSNTISFFNGTCDTVFIDSIYVTPPFQSLTQLPIGFKLKSTGRVPVLYAPDTISNDTGYAIVEYTANGTLMFDTVKLEGTSKVTGSVNYAHTLDFGTTSLCSSIDSQIVFSNSIPCFGATIDSISIAPPFQVLSKLPLTIGSDTSGGLQVRYSPDSNASDTGHAVVTLTINGNIVTDTLTFIGTGSGGGGANLLSTAVNDSIVFTRSECDPLDTVPFYLYNPGCHSLAFTSGFNIIADSAGAWNVIPNATPSLAARDSILIALATHDTLPGIYTGLFQTSYIDSNGTQRPFTLWIAETITRTPRTMVLDTTPIDLDTIAPCQTMDTVIPYTNTSCLSVVFDAWHMLHFGDGFQVYNINIQPVTIPPGATDSLHVTFDGSHTGVIYDTVSIIVGTDNDSVRRIPVQTFVPPVDSANFFLKMPPSLTAEQYFSVGVFPDRIVNATKGLTSVAGRLLFPDNDFQFDSLTQAPGLQLQKSGPVTINGIDREDFSVSNPAGIALDPTTPIVQLWLEALLTDSIGYSITLDSLELNGGDPTFSQCTLASVGSGVSAQFTSACGDSLIIETMQGRTLLFSTLPAPNPLGASEGDYVAQLTLQSFADGVAEIDLCDALGRSISSQSLSLKAGETVPCSLDLRNSPSGSYFYTIRYVSAMGATARNGSILVIR